jgi:hypothetical protein
VAEAKTYLGDGVYVSRSEIGLELTTEDGISVTNRIFLEPEVLGALLRYVERLSKEAPRG